MTLTLRKGSAPISMAKPTVVRARAMWPAATDYDLAAEVLYHDGHSSSVATFAAAGRPASSSTPEGSVRHLGDIQRSEGGYAEEIIEIFPNAAVRAVLFWVYSAQSNGDGSFQEYGVSMEISDGDGNTIRINSDDASDNPEIYTCAPGMIEIDHTGVTLHALGLYSAPESELRPLLALGADGRPGVWMDAGPVNDFK